MGRLALQIGDVIENGYGKWSVDGINDRRANDRHARYVFKHIETNEIRVCSARELRKARPMPDLRISNPMKKHPLYSTYSAMKSRCYNPNHDGYYWYGAKGIKVCDRWLQSFWNFVEDVGERPLGTTLDRIDGEKDYSPNNCKWSTSKEQASNRKPNSGWRKKNDGATVVENAA
jgi:hypothetical protein